jgi:hypothetical protein
MGILDDAIREHLDLKRSHGATDSELRRLEDEAFGPPSRPGEPDFPESEEAPAQAGNGVAAAETTILESPGAPEAPVAPPAESPPEPEPEPPGPDEDQAEVGTGPEAEPAEEAAAEHPVVEAPAESAPDDRTAIYDHTSAEEARVEDLDLELEEPPPSEPPSEEASAVEDSDSGEPPVVPIESLETVEHPFPDEVVEPEAPPTGAPEPAADEPGAAPPPAIDEPEAPPSEEEQPHGEEGAEEGDDDVLADTPEFLKDAPEDDELWFEQGEPKDFDF